ncbi:hypothetical protein AOC36_10440 [Erysipelothrix larvae]|uniref:Uncharacterized protein n=1 Tax=Erysipelothrix larvae TaxID=1514105 RepID=A0A0X8H1H1_9FIRM|nr:hypothetical protein [Erysipelothrix larvae]AMC94374.1 hypothetical protein AOC36_10440 [Erysipelothrix larvae]
MKQDIEALIYAHKEKIASLKQELGNKTLELNSIYQKHIDTLLNEIESLTNIKEEQNDEHQEDC